MKTLLTTFTIATCSLLFNSCASNPNEKDLPTKPVVVNKPGLAMGSTAALANKVLKHPKITLMRKQVSGRVDGASAYHNIASAARGYSAKRSSYGKAPGGYTKLSKKMLQTMLYLADVKGYSYNVTSIAGGSHSRTSRHYIGKAFDVNRINGRQVNYSNPYKGSFMSTCRSKGATEVLGPGDRAHSTHLHLAWPR